MLDHEFMLPASRYTPLDEEHIPTGKFSTVINYLNIMYIFLLGEIASVENTVYDFQTLSRIGDHTNKTTVGCNAMLIVDGEGKRSFGK